MFLNNRNNHAQKNKDIDVFIEASKVLNGRQIIERSPWNTQASADVIRHFAYGTSDDNPLWINPSSASGAGHENVIAPPAFVCSVLYPFLHGAPMVVPLSSLISEISIEWFHRIRCGDGLTGSARQVEVIDSFDRLGRRSVFITAETIYRNQYNEVVARALGTMARIARENDEQLLDREIFRYNEKQRADMRTAIGMWRRSGSTPPMPEDIWVGMTLPVFMRGPLSIGDLICWQAAIGPSYRAGTLGFKDTLLSPQMTAINPVTGWPVKYSQQHEDFLLAAQRGMPAPFDNSLMRFAWLAPMLTDWMGDDGFLLKLSVQTGAPILYGDTTWYRGIVIDRKELSDGRTEVTIRIIGVNQLGDTTTTGEAVVLLPKSVGRCQAAESATTTFGGKTEWVSALDRFDSWVRKQPDVPAIATWNRSLSFSDLNDISIKGAAYLVKRGIGPGSLVGHIFSRTLDGIAAIFAIMRSGATYLPLPPDGPIERLVNLLDTASPRAVLCGDRQAKDLSALFEGQALEKILWSNIIAAADDTDFRVNCPNPSHLAYVMPTSGTSGAPRLVAVSHGSLGLYLDDLEEPLGIGPGDRYLHTASFTFSASIRQLFASLCNGSCLVIADEEDRKDLIALMVLIKDLCVTVWDTVPSVWQNCIEAISLLPENQRMEILKNNLRLVCTTGEALPWKTVRMWRKSLHHASKIINLYSQTETAGSVCSFTVEELPGDCEHLVVPLGKTLGQLEAAVFDDALCPLATGETGEICVTGRRLASGYLGHPEATMERFPLIPFNNTGFYRTGDRGRIGPDGVIEFAGRSDLRVKIRGQRVELEEIENVLNRHPEVKRAIVTCLEDPPGSPNLVAYICRSVPENSPSTVDLLNHLRQFVSEAALPSRFVYLSEFPLNPSGKIDRSTLPIPPVQQASHPDVADDSISSTVRRFFLEALAIPRMGDYESFFDLGGNSLMASRVLTRLRVHFNIDLPMRIFFDDPRIAPLSLAVEKELLHQIEQLSEEEASNLLYGVPSDD